MLQLTLRAAWTGAGSLKVCTHEGVLLLALVSQRAVAMQKVRADLGVTVDVDVQVWTVILVTHTAQEEPTNRHLLWRHLVGEWAVCHFARASKKPCTNCHFIWVMNVWTLLAAITFAEPVIKHAVLVLHSGGSIVLAILGCRRRKFTSVDGTTGENPGAGRNGRGHRADD